MRHDTFIPKDFEVDFISFKAKFGRCTSKEICLLIRDSLK